MPSELENTDLGKPTLADHRVEGRLIFFRFLKWGSIGLVVFLIGGVIAFYQYENWAGRKAWLDTKAEYEAKGVSFDLQSYNPVMPPDDQNFAKSKVIRSLTEYTGDPRNPVYVDPKTRDEFLKMKMPSGNRTDVSRGGKKEFGIPVNMDYFVDRYVESEEWNPSGNPENWNEAKMAEKLAEFDQQIQALAAEARRRPESQLPYPIPANYEESLKVFSPENSDFIKAQEWLVTRAHFALAASEPEIAADCIHLLFRFGELSGSRPQLISNLISVSLLSLATRVIWDGLDKRLWTANELSQFREKMLEIDCLASSADAIEQCLILESVYSVDYFLGNSEARSEILDGVSFFKYEFLDPLALYFPRGWWERNRAVCVRLSWDHLIVPLKNREYSEVLDVELYTRIEELPLSEGFFNQICYPVLEGSIKRAVNAQAELDLALAACTIELFLLKKGRLPESVEEIRSDYPDGFRNDIYYPIEPLKFREDPDNGRFFIYSVGPNRIDNGGIAIAVNPSHPFRRVDQTASDLVWRYSSSKILKAKAAYEAAQKAKN